MAAYTVDHLTSIGADEFEATLRRHLSLSDAHMEGYADPARQRDLSIRFRW
jgi:hypothetical protein